MDKNVAVLNRTFLEKSNTYLLAQLLLKSLTKFITFRKDDEMRRRTIDTHFRALLTLLIACVTLIVILTIRMAWTYTNQPEFCISCHEMKGQYRNWTHSSHRNWADCADCHMPRESIVTKLASKARDGVYHGLSHLFNKDPVLIRITKLGEDTVMNNCVRCHEDLVAGILHKGERRCWECHKGVAHGY